MLGLLYTLPELLRRSAGRAGFQRQGHRQGRRRAARARRGGAEGRQGRQPTGHCSRRQQRQGPPRRHRHAAQGARTPRARPSTPTRENPSYMVALNLLSSSPAWLTAIHALPMYLGLDLRGGVHFLLQVDMKAALTKRLETLRRRHPHRSCATRTSATPASRAKAERSSCASATPKRATKARKLTRRQLPDLLLAEPDRRRAEFRLTGAIKPEAEQAHQELGAQAEHQHAAQPDQRTGRRRAGDPAAGRRPHRGAAARRAGHRQGEGDPRPHRDAGNPHGGRGEHEPDGARRRGAGPGAVRRRSTTSSAAARRCW